ncbi:hypothetical protein [Cellulomonas sp. NPDC058312]|uniref:ORC-CDC6 family AAA ATPase n=1 Tax=Cellulomonas sp. NPDC058312 TaxID=3346441 RepID=UPI0036ED9A54
MEGPDVGAWDHIGLYWRIDTNVVAAFAGGRVERDEWSRMFGHYINLSLVSQLLDFLSWARSQDSIDYSGSEIELSGTALALQLKDTPGDLEDFRRKLKENLVAFEADVNNIDDGKVPRLSIQGRPIVELVRSITTIAPFKGKTVYFLLDEFENLSDYQQRCFNTLIKHSGDAPYTFKVGVKETGHREVGVAHSSETLIEPSDFVTIDISDRLKKHDFAAFADSVCTQRLSRIAEFQGSMQDALPKVTAEDEARILGAQQRRQQVRAQIGNAERRRQFDQWTDLQAVFVGYWSGAMRVTVDDAIDEFVLEPSLWRKRLNNHQNAMLFTLRRGMVGQRKLYAGWETFVALAEGNIRYLLQLVGEALSRHIADGKQLTAPVSPEIQTAAAQQIGLRILKQLPGMAAQGAQLAKLVLGLGRVFQVMASQPEGHTPEISQFRTEGSPSQEAQELLDAAVMHLALVRFPGDKRAANSGETSDWNYMLHPIFAPYFVYSHRRKRRMTVSSRDLIALTKNPSPTIGKILQKHSRNDRAEPLPEQLDLFEGFYGAAY